MAFRTLYIRDNTKVRLYLDNLVVDTTKGPVRFLISDLQCVIFDNLLMNTSIQLFAKLISSNVCVVICGANHMPLGTVLSFSGNNMSSGRLNDQLKWKVPVKQRLTRKIIQAKISIQSKLLKSLGHNETSRKLCIYADEVLDGDTSNREGLAAKIYFRSLFGKNFMRFDDDVINGGLNYGYAILRSNISTILAGKGVNCSIGIFHHSRSNAFNLSDDVIEVFRPLVDWHVYNLLVNSDDFGHEEKLKIAQLLNSRVIINNQNQSLFQGIEIYVECLLSILDEKISVDEFINPELVFSYED